MFQIRVNGAAMKRPHVDSAMMNSLRGDGAAMRGLCVACALAFALGFAQIASADSMEAAELASEESTDVAERTAADSTVVAELASTDSTEVAEFASTDSTGVAAAILFDDAMPRGPSITDRLAIIREKIQNALEYPPLAQLHESNGDALVRFEIDRSGSAQNIHVVESSGHERLDISAVRAVETASPLPWVYGPLEVPVHFKLTAPR
jgi:TonB family protein